MKGKLKESKEMKGARRKGRGGGKTKVGDIWEKRKKWRGKKVRISEERRNGNETREWGKEMMERDGEEMKK